MLPAGVCGLAGMNPSPIPAKEKSSSVDSKERSDWAREKYWK